MNELIDKVNNLKNTLDKEEAVVKIRELKEKVMKDSLLLDDIKKYQNNPNDKLKEKIINNKLFREYKHEEVEINLIIMKINQILKTINDESKGCL